MGVTALNIARRWYRGHDFPWIVEREKGETCFMGNQKCFMDGDGMAKCFDCLSKSRVTLSNVIGWRSG